MFCLKNELQNLMKKSCNLDVWQSLKLKKYFTFPILVLSVVSRGHGGTLIELNFDIPKSDFLQF